MNHDVMNSKQCLILTISKNLPFKSCFHLFIYLIEIHNKKNRRPLILSGVKKYTNISLHNTEKYKRHKKRKTHVFPMYSVYTVTNLLTPITC